MTFFRRFLFTTAAMCGALACVYIARGAADTTATSDTAVIESFTTLASQGRLLLGPYSRFQWHHPGPLYFYLMAPFYALSGSRTTGLNVGALVLNVAGLALVTGILRRRASARLAAAAGTALALLVLRVPDLLTSPWNAHVPVVAAIVMLVAAAAALSGAESALPLVALFASLAAQAHVALLPLSLAVGVAATAGLIAQARRRPEGRRRELRGLLLTAAVLTLCWLPSLVEEFAYRPGNLGLIWTFFVSQSHPARPLAQALSAWSDMIVGPLRPDFYLAHGWPFVESPVRWAEALACIELVVLAASAFTSKRTGRRFEMHLSAVLLGASLVSLWSATRIDGEIFDHAVFWFAGIGTLNLAVVAAWLSRIAVPQRDDQAGARWTAMASTSVLLVVAVVSGVGQLRGAVARSLTPDAESQAASAVAGDLHRLFREQDIVRPLIRFDQEAWGMAAGVVLRLQKEGVPVAVENDWIAMYTPAFAETGREAIEVAVVGRAEHVRRLTRPGERLVSARDLLFAHLANR